VRAGVPLWVEKTNGDRLQLFAQYEFSKTTLSNGG